MSQDDRDHDAPPDPSGSAPGAEPAGWSGESERPSPAEGALDDTQPIGSGQPRIPGSEDPTAAQPEWSPPQPPVADAGPESWYGRPPQTPDTAVWPGSGYAAGRPSYGPTPPTDPWYGVPPGPAGHPAPTSGQRPGQPGWFWPVVVATALVVGLLGGTLAAVAVSSSMSGGGSVNIPVVQSDDPVRAPLEADNGSISAVAQQLLPSTVQILAGRTEGEGATGSGFVLDRRGHVITNNHVVAEATADGEIEIVDHEGRKLPAEIVGRSAVYDIAVLRVEGAREVRPAALGSSRGMRVGESVVAIGSPLGLSSTVTSGIVSALDRPVTTGNQDESSYINAVQTDAAINPGNSGGPLVNMRGEVIGVNSAIATMGGAFTRDSGNIGVGFAIPMEQVRVTATQILQTGEARYPIIGANVNTGDLRGGAEVVDVPSGTPAASAGLQEGDIVVGVDDKQITDGIGLIVAIRSHQPGETVRLTVRRGSNEVEVDVVLDAKVG